MKIAYCTSEDPLDKRSWSGTPYYVLSSLKKHFEEIAVIGPVKNKWLFWAKSLNFILKKTLNKRIHAHHTTLVAKEYGRRLSRQIKKENCDVLFIPAGSSLIAYLKTDLPIIYLTDATFHIMIDYHKNFSSLLKWARKMGDGIESRALRKSALTIFPSQWAMESAIRDYSIPRGKVEHIPLGANLEHVPSREAILRERSRGKNTIKMLFVGSPWNEKGGSIAYEALLSLIEMGIDAELNVCGAPPPAEIKHERLHYLGFQDKNIPEQLAVLERLYLEASVFILPTRNECFGIVFCEAAAFGLPALANDTGGVGSIVIDGQTGYCLPASAGGREYAVRIAELCGDRDRYLSMCMAARDRYEEELNWEAWGRKVSSLIKGVCEHPN